MAWFDILKYLQAELKKQKAAQEIKLGAYDPRAIKNTDGIILLMRGNEQPDNDSDMVDYETITLYLECWIRYDGTELYVGYEKLAALESKVDAVLQKIRTVSGKVTNNIQLMDIQVSRKTGDPGGLRPLYGVQYEITVTVYESED